MFNFSEKNNFLGKQLWTVRNFRHYANGITWDPRGKYIVTVSTDRRLDILEASKGTRLRCCHKIELPQFIIGSSENVNQQVIFTVKDF